MGLIEPPGQDRASSPRKPPANRQPDSQAHCPRPTVPPDRIDPARARSVSRGRPTAGEVTLTGSARPGHDSRRPPRGRYAASRRPDGRESFAMSGLGRNLRRSVRRFLAYLVLLGLFLTFRGYRSREVDQAYRLPILLHQQDARLYADDPFVRAFDGSIPHRGYLALLDAVSRPLGLSAGAGGPVRADVPGHRFWPRPPRLGGLGRSGRGDGLVAASLGAGRAGRERRDEPPVRADAAGPPDRLRARAGRRWRSRSGTGAQGVRVARRRPSDWPRWSTRRWGCNWRCSWG